MKRLLFLLPAMFISCGGFAEVVRLNCATNDNAYNVVVDFLDDGAYVSVNGVTYTFTQEYDAPVSFYNPEPWMRVEIGRRNIGSKYGFAAMEDGLATYMPCEEIL